MRWIVILFLLLIIASLGSALFYLVRDRGTGTRTVKALSLRVALSAALFVLLVAGYAAGWIDGRL
ncbi:MAG: twin transmembrane helix small protein [Rhodocyclaceae bacterium]|nr:twin transmembrane helix small protein [Rhodocyclaceae bacterium]